MRLLITAAGVSGGYIQDRYEGPARLPDPEADSRNVLGKMARPMQYPDRAGFTAYVPAGLAFLASGVVQNLTAHNWISIFDHASNVAGMPDAISGSSLLAGYVAVILLKDPRTGEVVQSFEGASITLDPELGAFRSRDTGELLEIPPWHALDLQVADENGGRSMNLFQYWALPERERPKLTALYVRKPALTDLTTRMKNALADQLGGKDSTAKTWELGRFQLFMACAAASTYLGWGELVDRATRADWPRIAQGLASGDLHSPQFWHSLLEGGIVATQTATAAAFTAANVFFGMARSEESTPNGNTVREEVAPLSP